MEYYRTHDNKLVCECCVTPEQKPSLHPMPTKWRELKCDKCGLKGHDYDLIWDYLTLEVVND